MKNIQILVSDKEYEILEKEALKKGMTVSLFIKAIVLPDDEFDAAYQRLLEKVEELPEGTKFTIQLLFGVEWTFSRGIKLTLGKTYFKRVSDGSIDNVEIIGKDSSRIMWYLKK